ncbi:MAG: polyribonucleotide nucleotidyltransferase [Chlamydiia bacterium]|nr:polyribonucleotide nucleotidyltransferase [Chlamydiia bacterium]
MNLEKKSTSVEIDGKKITLETGKIARQASGAVVLRVGDTMVFSTACMSPEPAEGVDFFPLRVDYQEKFSSAGKTLAGFIKREGRPTQKETLVSRLIDRPLRPMFEEGLYNEVQVLSYVWSYDGQNAPEPYAITACSAALAISDIPLIKPVAGVRVGFVDNKFVVNPTNDEQAKSSLDLLLAGTEDAILMIEGFCDFLTEAQVIEALETGHNAIKKLCHTIDAWAKEVGKAKNRSTLKLVPDHTLQAVKKEASSLLSDAIKIKEKQSREEKLKEVKDKVYSTLLPDGVERDHLKFDLDRSYKQVSSDVMRQMILKENIRSDGRDTKTVRPIDIEQSPLPRTHGSSLFTRGETQTMAICTLGGESMGQRFESLDEEGTQRFYLQYFFPPFSVGEVGRMGSAGRREIGHGKLAERAIAPTLPSKENFPYTIRLESNITESNGSSSMASVCGGCLALMDAGVPIKRPVSGIAMGLILEGDQFVILSDILGVEDALGDMDFKITGDNDGITAFQMDIKVEGITLEIMKAALAQAKEGRKHILQVMLQACPEPKKEMSAYAPRIETIQVKPSKIGAIIGPGGKMIRKITEDSGAQIDIDDDGVVSIASNNEEGMRKAKQMVMDIIAEVEIGKTYNGKITSIQPFGLFVEILPGKEGLCHISEYDFQRIESLNGIVNIGDMVTVKVLDINERGQIKLSRKATLKPAESAS